MSDVSRILSQIEMGDRQAAEELLPLLYEELRKLAAAKLAQEKPGQTLQATALVHEAWLRLVGNQEPGARSQEPGASEVSLAPGSRPLAPAAWNSRGHFFAAAAEAMRRILTDAARRKMTARHGGEAGREDLPLEAIQADAIADPAETLAVHELLDQLAAKHPRKAEVVKLRYFVGCSQEKRPKYWESRRMRPRRTGCLPGRGSSGSGAKAMPRGPWTADRSENSQFFQN